MRKSSFVRILSLLIAVMMIFTACSSKSNTDQKQDDDTKGASTNNDKVIKPTDAESKPVDKGSETVDKGSLWFDEELVVTLLIGDNANQTIKNFAPAQQEIYKKTNVKLEFQVVPGSSYGEKRSVLLATNNFPDIITLDTSIIMEYADDGIFVDLTPYVNEKTMPNFYALSEKYNSRTKKVLVDGKLYGFPTIQRDEARNGFGPIIRTDLLEANNIPIPDTFDELIDTLVKLKDIYPESIPYTGRKGTSQLLKTLSYMLGSGYGGNGLYYDYDVDGGKYVFGPATKEFKSVLSFLNECYDKEILDPDFATTTAEQFQYKMTSGQSLFFVDNSGFGQNYTNTLRQIEGKENATLQVIPIPENDYGQRRAIAYETILGGKVYSINSNVKRLDDIITFFDWLYSEEGSNITNYGVEGESFYLDDKGEPHFIDEYINSVDTSGYSAKYYAVYSELGITKLNFSPYATNTKTQFEIQRITGEWTEVTDEYWKIIEADKAYEDPYVNPSLTKEESDRSVNITLSLTTMLEQEYNNYIMGIEPIDNWDKVIERANELGAQELADIYNTADDRY